MSEFMAVNVCLGELYREICIIFKDFPIQLSCSVPKDTVQ
jgi:hypothetical protein